MNSKLHTDFGNDNLEMMCSYLDFPSSHLVMDIIVFFKKSQTEAVYEKRS